MNYTIGREDISATIFVPYDCNNNCKFCNSKAMYKNINKNQEHLFAEPENTIKFLSNNGVVSWVLTGGEPFANLVKLKRIIKLIKDNTKFKEQLKIYINTTLPKTEGVENILSFINDKNNHINGISISRHKATFEEDSRILKNIFEDELLSLIEVPVRINIVVDKNTDIEKIVNRYDKRFQINFRKNYLEESLDTLHKKDDFFYKLNEKYKWIQHSQCNVCDTDAFLDKKDKVILYHKGTMLSSFKNGNTIKINDFIIGIDGKVYTDWDFKTEVTQDIFDSIYESLI